MKKTSLIRLYENCGENKSLILTNLYKLMDINSNDDDYFVDFFIKYKSIIDEYNFDSIYAIFDYISCLRTNDEKKEFIAELSKIFELEIFEENAHLVIQDLEGMIINFNTNVLDECMCAGEYKEYMEFDYKIELLKSIIKIMSTEYENVSFDLVIPKLKLLLEYLHETKYNNSENLYGNAIKRLHMFLDMINSEYMKKQNINQFLAICNVAIKINDLSQFQKLSRRLCMIDISDNDYRFNLEQYCDELNPNTIDIILKQFDLESDYSEDSDNKLIIESDKVDSNELIKVLKRTLPEKTKKVLKKQNNI